MTDLWQVLLRPYFFISRVVHMMWEVNKTDLQHMTRWVCCLVTSLVPIVLTDYTSIGLRIIEIVSFV